MKTIGLCLVFTTLALAQLDQSRLAGSVADSTGFVSTNEQGPNLSPSTYTVAASHAGMSDASFQGVNLAVGQERNLNITMQLTSVSTEVNVSSGELAVIDTSSASVGANINAREVAQMPINGRQISQLYLLAPGAQTAGGGSYDNIRFSGRANQQNAVRFDGVEASSIIDASPGNLNGQISSSFRLQASLETVQEFRVESSNYPAEYGTGAGGQITIITKSGGNAYHGSVFDYLRNNELDARNFFDGLNKSPLRLNQFGGSLGGSFIKDKLSFSAIMKVFASAPVSLGWPDS